MVLCRPLFGSQQQRHIVAIEKSDYENQQHTQQNNPANFARRRAFFERDEIYSLRVRL
jgi:hypothetical protein